MNLKSVTSTTSPVNAGDAVFTFAVADTDALNSWIQTVAANTNSTLQLTSATGMPLICSATSGTYVVSVQINSNTTGLMTAGSVAINLDGAKTSPVCKPGQECTE